MIITLKMGLAQTCEEIKFKNFYELQTHLSYTYKQMLELVETHLKKGGYNLAKIKEELSVEDLSILLKDIPY